MKTELVKFPCLFPIKIMGLNNDNLITQIVMIINKHVIDFNPKTDIASKTSREAKYLSITATITATSQEQLDKIYIELNQHKLVKITL